LRNTLHIVIPRLPLWNSIHDGYHIGLGVGFMGFGFGSILPVVFDQVSRQVPRSQTVQAKAIVTSMVFFGQFSSPIFLDVIGVLFGNDSIRFMYLFLSSGMFVVVIVFFVFALKGSLWTVFLLLRHPDKLVNKKY